MSRRINMSESKNSSSGQPDLAPPASQKEFVETLFKWLDKDSSGEISTSEVVESINSSDSDIPDFMKDIYVQQFLLDADVDSDKSIDAAELQRHFREVAKAQYLPQLEGFVNMLLPEKKRTPLVREIHLVAKGIAPIETRNLLFTKVVNAMFVEIDRSHDARISRKEVWQQLNSVDNVPEHLRYGYSFQVVRDVDKDDDAEITLFEWQGFFLDRAVAHLNVWPLAHHLGVCFVPLPYEPAREFLTSEECAVLQHAGLHAGKEKGFCKQAAMQGLYAYAEATRGLLVHELFGIRSLLLPKNVLNPTISALWEAFTGKIDKQEVTKLLQKYQHTVRNYYGESFPWIAGPALDEEESKSGKKSGGKAALAFWATRFEATGSEASLGAFLFDSLSIEILSYADKSKNGTLSRKDLNAIWSNVTKLEGGDTPEALAIIKATVDWIMNHADVNDDNLISVAEWLGYFSLLAQSKYGAAVVKDMTS